MLRWLLRVCITMAVCSVVLEAQGIGWTQKLPSKRPSTRTGHASAYDAKRGQVVLFGGVHNGTERLNDTWVWDGENWTQKSPTHNPPPRYGHRMAYDAARGQVVLFGGEWFDGIDLVKPLNDTWVWDGEDWARMDPPNKPRSRVEHAMIYDEARGQIVLFGGFIYVYLDPEDEYGYYITQIGDTWVWNGSNWTQKETLHNPGRRAFPAMAYDAIRSETVLFGGCQGVDNPEEPTECVLVADTWVWNGADWIRRSLLNDVPWPRGGHAMAFDRVNSQVVLFGGSGGESGYLGDTWIWNGTIWTEKTDVSSPPRRAHHTMVYDGARGEVVLFGGYDGRHPISYDDTWIWHGSPVVPTVLVHGYCSSPTTFGQMSTLLTEAGVPMATPFDYQLLTELPANAPYDYSIMQLAALFGQHVRDVKKQTGAPSVDVVAHSMGGLVARAWMAGLSVPHVPYASEIRRLVTIGTPHYGVKTNALLNLLNETSLVYQCSNWQKSEMQFGSEFLMALHRKWNAGAPIPSASVLAVAGTQGVEDKNLNNMECNESEGCDDGVVDISSASPPSAVANKTRYVPYKHSGGAVARPLGPALPIQQPSDDTHLTYRLVRDFLKSGTVLPQCCDVGNDGSTLNYNPPHLRGVSDRQEGLLKLRLLDGRIEPPGPLTIEKDKKVKVKALTLDPYQPSWSYADYTNSNVITLLGLKNQYYSQISVTVEVDSKTTLSGSTQGAVDLARPTVLDVVLR